MLKILMIKSCVPSAVKRLALKGLSTAHKIMATPENLGSNPVVVGIEVMSGKGYNAAIIKQSSHQNDKYQPTFRH